MLQLVSEWVVHNIFRLNPSSKPAQILSFFIYDSLKILFLLWVMISIIGFLRTFISAGKMKAWLIKQKGLGNLVASLFGAVTPFCSCSSIPIFLSFLKAQIPLGIAFSFLVTSPLINEYLAVLMLGFFGWKITAAYVISGVVIGVASGFILGRMRLERYLEEDIVRVKDYALEDTKFGNIRDRLYSGIKEARTIVSKLWIWVLLGVGIGALIHNFIPQEGVQRILGKAGFLSVPAATLLGVPMYGSCAAIAPVAVVLFQKGFPLGVVLSFMMAVSALSLPEAIMLRRAMRLELIALFFGVTTAGIIITGYLFNLLQAILI